MSDDNPTTDPTSRAASLQVRGLERGYPDFHLGPVDFHLARGETLVVLGPNGSGKTTLLRVLAGLEEMDRGRVLLDGQDITRLPAHRRGIGMVFQDLALFPERTVWDNLTYGLFVQHWPRVEAESRGEELLRTFRLSSLADRRPGELSGGERQRVALGRALAPRPRALLLDEPLSSADPRVARELRAEIKDFLLRADIPAVYVTHDFDEGFFLGHRVAILHEGRWEQEGPAPGVFDQPRTAFAAWFLGYNVVPGPSGREESLAVLPEDIRFTPPGEEGSSDAVVESRGEAGVRRRYFVRLRPAQGEGALLEVLASREGSPDPRVGDTVGVHFERLRSVEGGVPRGGFKSLSASG
ncbi:MAG: ABC transporter ATP-binding protein [Euryarchaeota archaeon]|nr:ABC transporter ATP-binding protein [Euryarchaeota archaeon]MDE1880799.1 ABC transporter ATP-binding protein [Euryarchaeota archaeon]